MATTLRLVARVRAPIFSSGVSSCSRQPRTHRIPIPRHRARNSTKPPERARDYDLNPTPDNPEAVTAPGQLFTVIQNVDTESLLANLSETLASANAMIEDLAFDLNGSHRHLLLGIQQLIELGSLLANRALDNVEQHQPT